jgi:uncharacterized membrane protein
MVMRKLSGHQTQMGKARDPSISAFRRTGTWFFMIEMGMSSGRLIPTLMVDSIVISRLNRMAMLYSMMETTMQFGAQGLIIFRIPPNMGKVISFADFIFIKFKIQKSFKGYQIKQNF